MMWTPLLGLQVTVSAVLLFLYSLAVSLGFLSLSVLHTCKAGECGSLKDDSSVAHLIVAWPYLGCPEIHLCSGEEQAMQGQHDELLSTFSFLLCYFSERGPLIWALMCLIITRTNIDPVLPGYFNFSLSTEHFQVFSTMNQAQIYVYA